MESSITPQERKKMIDFLEAHPIDPAYDKECEYFDGSAPAEQLLARNYKKILDENPD